MPDVDIKESHFVYDADQQPAIDQIAERVHSLRAMGKLGTEALSRLRRYFKIKNIYNSNAIEGNILNIGETRQVVEQGLTLTGKPLKDQAEVKNLSAALDFLETLAAEQTIPISEHDVRQIHKLVLAEVDDDNAGAYRTVQVEISGSDYKPPGPESVPPQMNEFGQWLSRISVPADEFASVSGLLRALVAHTWFVQIHPFIDGNGRVARLLMNLILMRYGYPIAIITKQDRGRYYDALEESQIGALGPFIGLVCECLNESLEEYEQAVAEQRENEEWARSIAARFDKPQTVAASNEYEVWENAMELLRSYFRQLVNVIDQRASINHVYFKEFGRLEFEKYLSLRQGDSVKKTWFFRLDFRSERTAARYLFFFGRPSSALKAEATEVSVSLHVAREERPYHFERLDALTAPNVPNLSELAYVPTDEKFVARGRNQQFRRDKIENIGRSFIDEVVRMHFAA